MKRAFPVILITAGLLISLAAFGQIYRSNREPITRSGVLPARIAGLALDSSESGEAAISEFTTMHGKEFPVISGEIGHYGDGRLTLWVAGTSTDAVASEMVDSMRDRIAEGTSPFTPLQEIQSGNRKVYVLDGMGQKHFYFQSENLVIWLASDVSVADSAIQQILEVYP